MPRTILALSLAELRQPYSGVGSGEAPRVLATRSQRGLRQHSIRTEAVMVAQPSMQAGWCALFEAEKRCC